MAIKIAGNYELASPKADVWDTILDSDVLQSCIPGCEFLEEEEPGKVYRATVTTKIGPIKATFHGRVTLSDIDKPNAVRLSGAGEGGMAGSAKGSAIITLTPGAHSNTTLLTYEGDVAVGGKMAQLGSRMISAFIAKMANQFFDCLAARFNAAA